MIADIMHNKKFQAIIKDLFIRCKRTKYFTCYYHTVLFFCSKRCQIKFSTLFDYENRQQKRIAKYCNKSFYRYQRFTENVQGNHILFGN